MKTRQEIGVHFQGWEFGSISRLCFSGVLKVRVQVPRVISASWGVFDKSAGALSCAPGPSLRWAQHQDVPLQGWMAGNLQIVEHTEHLNWSKVRTPTASREDDGQHKGAHVAHPFLNWCQNPALTHSSKPSWSLQQLTCSLLSVKIKL